MSITQKAMDKAGYNISIIKKAVSKTQIYKAKSIILQAITITKETKLSKF